MGQVRVNHMATLYGRKQFNIIANEFIKRLQKKYILRWIILAIYVQTVIVLISTFVVIHLLLCDKYLFYITYFWTFLDFGLGHLCLSKFAPDPVMWGWGDGVPSVVQCHIWWILWCQGASMTRDGILYDLDKSLWFKYRILSKYYSIASTLQYLQKWCCAVGIEPLKNSSWQPSVGQWVTNRESKRFPAEVEYLSTLPPSGKLRSLCPCLLHHCGHSAWFAPWLLSLPCSLLG